MVKNTENKKSTTTRKPRAKKIENKEENISNTQISNENEKNISENTFEESKILVQEDTLSEPKNVVLENISEKSNELVQEDIVSESKDIVLKNTSEISNELVQEETLSEPKDVVLENTSEISNELVQEETLSEPKDVVLENISEESNELVQEETLNKSNKDDIKSLEKNLEKKNIKKNIKKISINSEEKMNSGISYIDGLIEDSKNIINKIEKSIITTSLIKIENTKNKEDDILLKNKLDKIIQNLKDNNINEYEYDEINKVFGQINNSVILFYINNGKIGYLEKKGMESRNQSIIDLVIQTHKYKPLNDNIFMIYTGDELNKNLLQSPFLLPFYKKKEETHNLFPCFTFQHWKELNNGNYKQIYDYMTTKEYNWSNKKDKLFWSGYSLNPLVNLFKNESNMEINIKNNNNSKSFYVEELTNYKYLLCIDDNLYSNRLNYMFLTKSCVIILKNENSFNEEYYHKYFNVNEDYFEIIYNNKTSYQEIKDKINDIIKNKDCEKVALNAFQKAKYIFNQDNIYEYIYNLLLRLSIKCKSKEILSKNIFFTSSINNYVYDRIISDNNQLSYFFRGNNFEIELVDKTNKIEISVNKNVTSIFYNQKNIFNYRIPNIISTINSIEYNIVIEKDILNILINKTIPIIKLKLPDIFTINKIGLKTNNSEGLWFT